MEQQGGLAPVDQIARLAAVEVGVEDETAFVVPLEQHHPDRRLTVRADRRQRHRIAVIDLGLARLGHPCVEQFEQIVRHQPNACSPVCARPRISAWMSCVPSYVFTVSRFCACRMT